MDIDINNIESIRNISKKTLSERKIRDQIKTEEELAERIAEYINRTNNSIVKCVHTGYDRCVVESFNASKKWFRNFPSEILKHLIILANHYQKLGYTISYVRNYDVEKYQSKTIPHWEMFLNW